MSYHFFADKNDKIKILEFIFAETDFRVFDLSSEYEKEIEEYKNIDEIINKFNLSDGGSFSVSFNLWSPRHKGKINIRKIELNPKYCNGKTFRYETNGWGLIQLSFSGINKNVLTKSAFTSWSKKGALSRETENHINGKVIDWDWIEIEKSSRKLKYQIHKKLAVDKIGSIGILEAARELRANGINFM